MSPRITVPQEAIEAFCRKWEITELELFGSVLRDDFRPDSDVDVLVSFAAHAHWSLLDHTRMEGELAALLGRSVDLITRRSVERSPNWIRRRAILGSARSIYASR